MPNEYGETDPRVEAALDNVPWADVPTFTSMPEQLYNFEVISVQGNRWPDRDDGTPGKAKVSIVCQILEPLEYRGRQHTENFTVGSDDDVYAENVQRWLNPGPSDFGMTALKRLSEFCNCATWRELYAKQFSAFTRNSKSQDGQREYTNLQTNQFYQIGEVLPGTPTVTSQRRRPRTASTSNGQPAAQAAPSEVSCPICQQSFPSNVILAHVKTCQGATP